MNFDLNMKFRNHIINPNLNLNYFKNLNFIKINNGKKKKKKYVYFKIK